MNYVDFKNKSDLITSGAFISATWRSEKQVNGEMFEKVSNGVVMFCNYENKAKVIEYRTINGKPTQTKTNNNVYLIKDRLQYNTNTKNFLVRLSLVQSATNHIQSKYYRNGKEIDKTEYYSMVKTYTSKAPMDFITVNLKNLIKLEQHHI